MLLLTSLCLWAGDSIESFDSRFLGRPVHLALHVPDPGFQARWRAAHGTGPLRLVLFLPGYGDGPEELMRRGVYAGLGEGEARGDLAPSLWVAPEHFKAWYADRKDGGFPYERFIREELIPALERRYPGFGGSREARSVAGLSMGAFGALNLCGRTAIFSRCAALSPALVQPPFNQVSWWIRRSLLRTFPNDSVGFAPWNPWEHLGGSSELVLACGTEDRYGLAEVSRVFAGLRAKAGRPVVSLVLRPGRHAWSYWTAAILEFAPWLSGRL